MTKTLSTARKIQIVIENQPQKLLAEALIEIQKLEQEKDSIERLNSYAPGDELGIFLRNLNRYGFEFRFNSDKAQDNSTLEYAVYKLAEDICQSVGESNFDSIASLIEKFAWETKLEAVPA